MIFILLMIPVQAALSACPPKSRIIVDTAEVISTSEFQSPFFGTSTAICNVEVFSSNGAPLIVSISSHVMFSHRQPKNMKEIIMNDTRQSYVVSNAPRAYRQLHSPILIKIPMNLNFRSVIVFSTTKPCSQDTFWCSKPCEYSENCTSTCLHKSLICDGHDSCGEDESNCKGSIEKQLHSSFLYQREVLTSSQLMLLGFFLLNGAFIVFFLVLSLFSAGICSCKNRLFNAHNKASRLTFVKYLREASVEKEKVEIPTVSRKVSNTNGSPSSIGDRRHRPSILSRINFDPSPVLKELEPESEDRNSNHCDDLCAPPKHRPEVFLRRQSLPLTNFTGVEVDHVKKHSNWKRSSGIR